MELLGSITQGELSRASGVSTTTISLFLSRKRTLRPTLAVRLVAGLERAFAPKGARLDTAFFMDGHDGRAGA
ncbi:MAG: helix-turn-helix transcriptional regulator [Planctomycetota bacterium]